ncbi:DUF4139 domain-containing protein [Novosphingobium album (ex Liu et al. 2023)]|uniref:DUF4139 domain-containing protein n=1 Tax=Novosphingobium album (ex Liu et al. 2023) TaxID=3031130 RepID=A0ABT5WSG8_9SPHN|nr:hypothetical protein [Novosphingobium album (ex Liu et al. 2023)]MDE8652983.1 hypothetical protein [Novosphingobium album (ex Liu et al. 2023)]
MIRRCIARLWPGVLALGPAGPALARQVVTSPAPEQVAVTIYRAADRGDGAAMDLAWLRGFALVTETRTVDIPAGEGVIRFEGVAAGMLPESALVTGLPSGVREKNLDADLLSPRSLYARGLGRPVTLRRRNPETGEAREEPAIVRASTDGGVIVQTKDGFEAADCGPLKDALSFDAVPEGLSARPTLSVATDAPQASRVTLTLSYLAWGFDWQASYVIRLRENGRKADVLAWVTLANGDPISFPDARAAVVAGKVHRAEPDGQAGARRPPDRLVYPCFTQNKRSFGMPPPGGASAPLAIVVTAQRREERLMDVPLAVTVTEEGLGDLKLYRVPMPTTIASQAQKQVALFHRGDVGVVIVHAAEIRGDRAAGRVGQRLRMGNRQADGLGVALPAGTVTVFEPHGGQPVLSGEGTLRDAAVGQDVEVMLGDAPQVQLAIEPVARDANRHDREDYAATVTNANPWPIAFEARLAAPEDDERIVEPLSAKLARKNGALLWKVTVPAQGTARLTYRLRRR